MIKAWMFLHEPWWKLSIIWTHFCTGQVLFYIYYPCCCDELMWTWLPEHSHHSALIWPRVWFGPDGLLLSLPLNTTHPLDLLDCICVQIQNALENLKVVCLNKKNSPKCTWSFHSLCLYVHEHNHIWPAMISSK